MGATVMSDYVEIINPRTMTCTLMKNGEIVDSYPVMQCDMCASIQKFDAFGYRKAAEDNPVWFCFTCRGKR